MKRSSDRILTTVVGSLARPSDLLDMMKAKVTGQGYDKDAYDQRVQRAVADVVRRQVDSGVDIVSDGEQGKTGFFRYVGERLAGFEPRTPKGGPAAVGWQAEIDAFPEYYEQYLKRAMTGGALAPNIPMVCTGPVSYRGQEAIQRDIANFKAALRDVSPQEAFMPSVAPSGVGINEYYRTEEEYLQAVAEAMRAEYLAIVDAGFLLQVDDPWLTEFYGREITLDLAERRKAAELYMEATNHAIRGIPAEKIRFHTCYGINEGPRLSDTPLKDIVDLMLKVNAGAYSFEAANARHEHEYHVWEDVKLPEGKIIIPGVLFHASNVVEHPELIAERLARYAKLVGRENVIAGTDCGFSSQATYSPEVHPTVVWAKFAAMAEGARLASEQLWP